MAALQAGADPQPRRDGGHWQPRGPDPLREVRGDAPVPLRPGPGLHRGHPADRAHGGGPGLLELQADPRQRPLRGAARQGAARGHGPGPAARPGADAGIHRPLRGVPGDPQHGARGARGRHPEGGLQRGGAPAAAVEADGVQGERGGPGAHVDAGRGLRAQPGQHPGGAPEQVPEPHQPAALGSGAEPEAVLRGHCPPFGSVGADPEDAKRKYRAGDGPEGVHRRTTDACIGAR